MLELGFMQRALGAALAVGLVCGFLGFYVVLRRLAFVGVGISHGAVGGVALGVALGVSPLLAAAVFSAAAALGIAWASERGRLPADAVIGVFLSGAMALAVVLFSLERGYQQDLVGYLFGNVLAVTAGELWLLAIAAAGVVGVLLWLHAPLLFVAFDEETARAYGHRVSALNALLLVLVAATVVLGVRLVGALLVQALLVVPAITAALWTRRTGLQIALSVALAAGASLGGLVLAYRLDVAAGGSIVLVAVAAFFASLALRHGRR